MNILSHVNVNLHSASSPNGLIGIGAGESKIVPDDVVEHPGFEIMIRAGQIVKLADGPMAKKRAEADPNEPNPQAIAEANANALAEKKSDAKPGKSALALADESTKVHADDVKSFNEMTVAQREEYNLGVLQGTIPPDPDELARRKALVDERIAERPFAGGPVTQTVYQPGQQKPVDPKPTAAEKVAADKAEEKAADKADTKAKGK